MDETGRAARRVAFLGGVPMQLLKSSSLCVAAILTCSFCASAQNGSGSGGSNGGGSSTGSGATGTSAVSLAGADASVSMSSSSSSSAPSGSSSSGSGRISDPSSIYDVSISTSLKRMMMNDGGMEPPITVTPVDTINQEDCGTWTQIGAHSATVSMVRLQVPGRARGVYLKACGELKKKKLDDAQRDAQLAVESYREYPSAWVLLGQAYYDSNKLDQAHDACSKASEVDPSYVASYLCLAAVANRQKEWDQAQDLSNHALSLSPLKNAYACYYKAEAAYNEGLFVDAEKNGLDAAAADSTHQMPEIELLLARVYSAMKNTDAAAVRVRDYLRFAHQPADPAAVSARLAQLNADEQSETGETAAH